MRYAKHGAKGREFKVSYSVQSQYDLSEHPIGKRQRVFRGRKLIRVFFFLALLYLAFHVGMILGDIVFRVAV